MDLENVVVKKDPVIIFMGTPDFSVPVLEGLIEKYGVRAIVTQPDKPVGRSGEVRITPIKEVAIKNNILCLQPVKIRDSVDEIRQLNPDLIVTCAYGQILPLDLLKIPSLGCINVHASLLPKLRGGAPIHHAIIDGYSKTGVLPGCISWWQPSARARMLSPVRSKATCRRVLPSGWFPMWTAGLFWTRKAPNHCWGWATCCFWHPTVRKSSVFRGHWSQMKTSRKW